MLITTSSSAEHLLFEVLHFSLLKRSIDVVDVKLSCLTV